MFRAWLFFIIIIGVAGSLAGRMSSVPSSGESDRFHEVSSKYEGRDDDGRSASSRSSISQDGAVELQRSSDGHFYADVRVNGSTLRMLVDTGASGIALSRDDARSAGVATSIGMNDVVGEGASGAVHGEFVQLERVELGPRSAEGLEAVVLNGGSQSLLGQSFLREFSSVQIEGDKMVLR